MRLQSIQNLLGSDEQKRTKWITNQLEVLIRYRIELGDNGLSGDMWVGAFVAPDETGQEWLYLETNGDPVLVASVDKDGEQEIELGDEVVEWIKDDSCKWLVNLLGIDIAEL
jgi:hypothetical protein